MSGSQLWAAVLLLLLLQSAQGVYIKVRPQPAYLLPAGPELSPAARLRLRHLLGWGWRSVNRDSHRHDEGSRCSPLRSP